MGWIRIDSNACPELKPNDEIFVTGLLDTEPDEKYTTTLPPRSKAGYGVYYTGVGKFVACELGRERKLYDTISIILHYEVVHPDPKIQAYGNIATWVVLNDGSTYVYKKVSNIVKFGKKIRKRSQRKSRKRLRKSKKKKKKKMY